MKNDEVHRIGNTDAGARATSGDERIAEPKSDASMIIFHDPDKEYGFLSNWYLSYLKVGEMSLFRRWNNT